MKKTNVLLTIIIALFLLTANVGPVLAGQYGEEEEAREISIDKKVMHPDRQTKGEQDLWVDNLFVDEYKFEPGQEVQFRITVTNSSNQDIENIKVKDTLPYFLNLESGAIEFTISKLEAGQTYTSDVIKARFIKAEEIKESSGTICKENLVEGWTDEDYDKDTANVCVEKKVLGMKEIPEAGPAESLAFLIAGLSFGTIGFALVKNK
jgi:uncharacterized repeat protein (TIGR01451 family)